VKWTWPARGTVVRRPYGDHVARSIIITETIEHTKIHMTAECQHLTVRVSRVR